MTSFEPGEGWRLLEIDEVLGGGAEVITHSTGDDVRSWVRYPTQQLASAAWTVMRLGLGPNEEVVVFDGEKYRVVPKNTWITVDDPQWPVQLIETLAEPRTVGEQHLAAAREAGARDALQQARHLIATYVKPGFELMPDGSEDPESAGYVAGLGTATAHVETLLRHLDAAAAQSVTDDQEVPC